MENPHSYTVHRGYYIYVPHEDDYTRDESGNYLVHARIENQETRVLETIPITDCIAATFTAAREASVKQAIRIVDERAGAPFGPLPL